MRVLALIIHTKYSVVGLPRNILGKHAGNVSNVTVVTGYRYCINVIIYY